jgi:hypothetical protein
MSAALMRSAVAYLEERHGKVSTVIALTCATRNSIPANQNSGLERVTPKSPVATMPIWPLPMARKP